MKGDPLSRVNNTDPRLRGENELMSREAYEYLTLRGQEEPSANSGNDLELLDWECRVEGEYKRRSCGSC